MKLVNRNIVIVSNEPWGDIWYSKHNYAYELSKQNKVFFLNPQGKWSPGDLFNNSISASVYSPRLTILDYKNFLPLTGRSSWIYERNNRMVSRALARWFSEHDVNDIIFWSFDPYRLTDPALLAPALSIYHSVDYFNNRTEKLLCENTDMFLTVSGAIAEKMKSYNKPLLQLPHGISSEEFDIRPEESIEIKHNDHVLYVGNIDERLDYAVIKTVAEAFPSLQFLFIGKKSYSVENLLAKEVMESGKHANITMFGPVHFKRLKHYIARARFCVAFMKADHPGNMLNHHKLLQYLAWGKPVFSPAFEDYKSSDMLYAYSNPGDAVEKIKALLENGEAGSKANERIAFAREHTYEKLLERIEDFITANAHRIHHSK
jgi:hypothetical protein